MLCKVLDCTHNMDKECQAALDVEIDADGRCTEKEEDPNRCPHCGGRRCRHSEPRGEFWGRPISEEVFTCSRCGF